MKIRQSSALRILAIMAAFMVAFTGLPMLSGTIDTSALSAPAKVTKLNGWALSQTSIKLTWKKPTKNQLKNISGITIYRNGKAIKNLGKNTTSFTNGGLRTGTTYNYVVKTYRTYKQKQWYNKKTKKWQTKAPTRRYRGKTRWANAKLYSGVARKYVTTKAAPAPAPAPTPTQPTNSDPYFFAPTITGTGAGDSNTAPNAQLSWGPVLSAQKFIVYRDNVKLTELSDTATGYGDFSVGWSETHTYKVSAVKGSSELMSNAVTITIPAKPAASEPITPEYVEAHGVYNDTEAQKAYGVINGFRMTRSNQWYRDTNGDIYTIPEGTLYELQRDENLERAAKQRAKEMWIMHFINGHIDNNGRSTPSIHYRPDGGAPGVTYQEMGVTWTTECLAWGYMNAQTVVYGTSEGSGWAEENEGYPLQGHRRAMLQTGNKVTKMGIACFSVNGYTSWCFVTGY